MAQIVINISISRAEKVIKINKNIYTTQIWSSLSLQLERVETLKYSCVCRPPFGKV